VDPYQPTFLKEVQLVLEILYHNIILCVNMLEKYVTYKQNNIMANKSIVVH
jgi:hypothetical protein